MEKMKNMFKLIWGIIKYPHILFKEYELALWFYIIFVLIVIFVFIPWGVGVITILDWIFL